MAKDSYQLYAWKGLNNNGGKESGVIPAENIDAAETQLVSKDIDIISLKKKSKFLPSKGQKPIKNIDIMLFFRQLATMMTAGIPLVQALEIISAGLSNVNVVMLIMTVHRDVSAGYTFAQALGKHPRHFSFLVCSLIEVGEQSGTLDTILMQIAAYLEKSEMLKSRVKKAMFYPATMLTVTIAVAVLLLTFIVPRFQELFASFGSDLPAATQVVVKLSKILQHQWWVIVGVLAVIIVLWIILKRSSYAFRRGLDYLSLHLPLLGGLVTKSIVARVTRTLAISLSSGIPLVTALECVAKVADNIVYSEAIDKVRKEVVTGQQFYKAVRETKLFPMMALQMISVGETSGELEQMLTKVADFYDEQVDVAVDGLSTLIEPVMLVLLGLIIGAFVVSMYLPIFKLGTVL